MAFKITRLRTWNFNAGDMEATVAFYREVLGAEGGSTHEARPGQVARLKLGSSGIGVFDAAGGPRPGVPHYTLEFEGQPDHQLMRAELESKGAKVEDVRVHGSGPGYSLYVTDPAGNRLELSTDPS